MSGLQSYRLQLRSSGSLAAGLTLHPPSGPADANKGRGSASGRSRIGSTLS